MKNKKIILGLGTITALGAMSVGFIACVKKKEIEDMNLSKLTKEEMQELLNNSLTDKHKNALEFSMKVMDHFKKEINSNNLGHFESENKVQDVIDRINKKLENEKWKVVENPQRDNTTWFNDNVVKDKNGQPLKAGKQKIKFRLKDKNDVETFQEFDFNFFVGQKNLSTITDKKIHHSATIKEKIVAELNKKEEFKNVNLEAKDFEIVEDSKKEPNQTKTGEIKIKAKDGNKKISGEVTLILGTVKQELEEKHLTGFVPPNNTTAKEIKDHINKHSDFNGDDKKIDESDFDFEKVEATEKDRGGIRITPKGKTEGKSFILDIPKLTISLSLDEIKNHDDIKAINDLKDLAAVNEALGKIKIVGVKDLKAQLKKDSTTDVVVTITTENTHNIEPKIFEISGAIKK